MKAYLIGLTAAAILAALIRRLAPDNSAGKAAKLGAGLLILITILQPLRQVDLMEAARALTEKGFQEPLAGQNQEANELLETLITDTAQSYILDKAQALGLEITAQVETRIRDYYPEPWSVRLYGNPNPYQRQALSQYISEQLGIPEERQEWSDM